VMSAVLVQSMQCLRRSLQYCEYRSFVNATVIASCVLFSKTTVVDNKREK